MTDFEHNGLACRIILTDMGHHCGYVGLPDTHPWSGKDYSDMVKVPQGVIERPIDIDKVGVLNMFAAGLKNNDETLKAGLIEMCLALDCHGGVTFADRFEGSDLWWIGFDCAHSGDGRNSGEPNWRDEAYVIAECKSLADQLAAIRDAVKPDTKPKTRLSEHLASPLWIVFADYGPKIGIGSADATPDSQVAQERYDDYASRGYPAAVWFIDGGIQVDVTEAFEARRQDEW